MKRLKTFIYMKLTNFVFKRVSRDMGIWFDEIRGNEEEIWHEIMASLEYSTFGEKLSILKQAL